MATVYRGIAVILAFCLVPIAGAQAATPRPDLVVSSITQPPATATPGTSFAATDRTRNRGTATAGKSTMRYFLSLDAKVNKGDMRLAEHRVPRLLAKKAFTKRVTLKVPTFAHAGTYRVLGCADRTSKVKESNERNNCAAARRRMRVVRTSLLGPGTPGGNGPALTIAPGDQSFGAAVGLSSAAVKFTVTNSGKSASGALGSEVTGTDAPMFKVSSDTCAGKTLAAGASCTLSVTFSPTSLGAKSASLQVSGAPGGLASANLTGTGQTAAALGISPASQDFPATARGSSSSAIAFTVTNNGEAVSGALGATLVGTDSSQFKIAQDNCAGITLAGGASCTVNVTLSPTSTGGKSASLEVAAAPGGTVSSSLTGTGLTPASVTIAPASQGFGASSVGSQGSTFTFTATNSGQETSGALSVAMAGPNPDQFVISANTCTGVTLAENASCTFDVTFLPSGSPGSKSASLQVSATPGTTGGPTTSTLTGTASPPALTINPTSQSFGAVNSGSSSGAFTFTVTNTGLVASGTLSATIAPGTDSTQFSISANTCTGMLGAGATCTLDVTFSPTSVGLKSASLQVTGSPGGTATATLSGTGLLAPPSPAALSILPSSQGFGSIAIGSSSGAFTFTVTNTGQTASGTLTTTLGGTHAAQFAMSANTCSGATLAGGASCTLNVTFTPTGTSGARSATLTVSGNPGGAAISTLSGTAAPAPANLTMSPMSQSFGTVGAGNSSGTFTFTVTNGGQSTSGTLATSVTGTHAAQFSTSSNTCTGTLAAGLSCTVNVTFTPTGSQGARTATLQVTGSPGGTAQSALTGTAGP